jgi:hypothetical protein
MEYQRLWSANKYFMIAEYLMRCTITFDVGVAEGT